MARQECFVCIQRFLPRQLPYLRPHENPEKAQIALTRRNAFEFPPQELNEDSRICVNCNRSIIEEMRIIEADPDCMRLNILTQTTSNTCLICNAENDVVRLSLNARTNVFILKNILIPEGTRSCAQHLDDREFIFEPLLVDLRYINRPYIIKGRQLEAFLQSLRTAATDKGQDLTDTNSLSDSDIKCLTGLTKDQFSDLFSFCDPIPVTGGHRNISKKHLLTYLCKMRQGLSDEFLKVIFQYSSRQLASMAIASVRTSLMIRFVPQNIGFNSISRDDYINMHVTNFANELYNPNPAEKKAIVCIDGTYSYINKSTNFRALRQSFCLHKGRHLVKPALIVAPDGYILAIHGPYFSDSRNNDARMLIDEFENDNNVMAQWFREGDIFIVDRGYRDAEAYLQDIGINVKMPRLLQGKAQFNTEEANESRLVTKTRWIIETRNGHFKSIFKFFNNIINMPHVDNLKDFFLIAGAIINKYFPLVLMQYADEQLAQKMLVRSREPNVVQARVEVDNLCRRNAQWTHLNADDVPLFPRLSLDYLRNLTFGTYQVRLSSSYIQDKLQHDDNEEYQLDHNIIDPSFLRIRVYSRYRNNTKYQIFISYNNVNDVQPGQEQLDEELINGYYCTCKSGARTLGACAHIASVLWYLGYARHVENVHYPSTALIENVQDAAHRPPQRNLNIRDVVDVEVAN